MMFAITSSAFEQSAAIPERFTCEGDDISPPLAWSGAPPDTRSFALIVDDPDAPDPRAPKRTWVHWIVADIPADAHAIGEDAAASGLPAGAREGRNDWNRSGWGGPCPPIGRHRYFFRLYALDTTLPDQHSPTRAQLDAAMDGHILARAELMGTYQKRQAQGTGQG